MATPSHIKDNAEIINFISEKVIYNKDKEEYIIKIGTNTTEDILVFKIIPENYKYIYYFQNKLTLSEFQQLSQAFNYFKSIKEIIFAFSKLKYDVYERNDEFIIQFKLFLPSGENQISEISFNKIFIESEKAIKNLLEEKRELKNIINKKDIEIAELKININNLKSKINDLESNIIIVTNYVDDINKKLQINSINENNIKELQEKILHHEDENYKLNRILSNYKTENARLNTLISQYDNEIKNQINALTDKYNKENQRLLYELNQAKIYKDKYEELFKIYDKLKIENEKLVLENNHLKIVQFSGDSSNIIYLMDDLQFVFNHIKKNDSLFQFNNLKLLYRGSRDGDKTKKCHELCDNKENVLIIIKSDIGNIFGGYSKIGFKTNNNAQYLVDNNCFLFSFDSKKIYPSIKNMQHICHINDTCGLCFNGSMSFFNNFMKEKVNLLFKESIRDYFNNLDEPCEMNGGKDKFRCLELEVFQFTYN